MSPSTTPGAGLPTGLTGPDVALARRVAAQEQVLLDRYAAAAAAVPTLAPRLRALAAEHEAHLSALADQVPGLATASAGPSGTAPSTAPVPARVALDGLRAAERAAARARVADLATAVSPALARLLAGIGAAEAAHAALLADG